MTWSTAGLYADMLPRGPWTSLAKGHSPEATAESGTPVAVPMTPIVSTQSAATISASPVPPVAPQPATRETPSAPAIAATQEPAPVPAAPVVAIASRPVAPPPPPPVVVPQIAPAKMTSPYFASVIDNPSFTMRLA